MNPLSKKDTKANEPFVFESPNAHRKNQFYDSFGKASVEMAAAGTTVTAYHPFRTISTELLAGGKVHWNLTALYRGYLGSAIAAHQLFLMAGLERRLKKRYTERYGEPTTAVKIAIGALAGVLTAPTVTPCDMCATQRQLNKPLPGFHSSSLFRGFVPTFFRQAGLGAGMFIFPGLMHSKLKQMFPEEAQNNERAVKMACSFSGGCATAIGTQFFEVARLLMQKDSEKKQYRTTWSAFKYVPDQIFSERGAKMMGARLSVVAVATIVMNESRERYFKWFFGGKG